MQAGPRLFTIGSSGTTAERFFERLATHEIEQLVDVRLNAGSQLLGFTKKTDLEYLARRIAGIEYIHATSLAPTPELLKAYRRRDIPWERYAREFTDLLRARSAETPAVALRERSCLLCSEPAATHCHRRLVAEYWLAHHRISAITHL